MLFPCCRNDKNYNYDFLDKLDKTFIKGFDWCTEMAVDNFFDNDMYDLLDEGSYLGKILNEELPEKLKESYTFHAFEIGEERRTINTYADLIRMKLIEYIEMERDELITSMIDNMDEDLYEAIRNKVLSENRESENPKQYFETRDFY